MSLLASILNKGVIAGIVCGYDTSERKQGIVGTDD